MLVITADDLGFSKSRNEAIFSAASAGTVSAASLMINMPAAESACHEINERGVPLDLGLHFTLTSGRPVASPDAVHLLLDSDGMFRHGFVSLFRYASKPAFMEQIRIEFESQCRRMDDFVRQFGLRLTHVDSHQHVHAIRPIWNLLAAWAKERSLSIRLPRESYGSWRRWPLFRQPNPIGDVKKLILDFCTRGRKTDDLYFGLLDSGKMDDLAWRRILKVVLASPNRRCEINVHPGCLAGQAADSESLCCSDEDRIFHRSDWRKRELDVLLNPEFVAWIKNIRGESSERISCSF